MERFAPVQDGTIRGRADAEMLDVVLLVRDARRLVELVDRIDGGMAMAKKKKKKWIAGMHLKRGALHKMMNVPETKTIPVGRLGKAAKAGGLLGRRARLALTMRKFKH